MSDFLLAIIFGFVEGMTEFLPVSSTGHLILTAELLNFTGDGADHFEVIIQIGAIFAVVWLYFGRFWGLLFPQKDVNTGATPKFSGFYGLYLLFLTCLPASLLGLIFHSFIKSLFSVENVLFFLVLGAICMIITEHLQAKKTKNIIDSLAKDENSEITSIDALSPRHAFLIGCFQIAALFPGFSRSASTIMGGMLLGLSRKTAAEYSFLAAVPIIVAAAGYDFLKNFESFQVGDISFFLVGIVSSFVFALFAIKVFISALSKMTLKAFAYYRIALAFVLYIYFFVL